MTTPMSPAKPIAEPAPSSARVCRRSGRHDRHRRSAAQLSELFTRWQVGGDQHARDELIEVFMPLTRRLARRYVGAREPLDDLQQVASLGLVKAINRFDPSRGLSFTSFAVPTILGELRRYFRDCG